jgi:hypothetical protein
MATYLLPVVGAPKPTPQRRKRKQSARARLQERLRNAVCICAEGTTRPMRITVEA